MSSSWLSFASSTPVVKTNGQTFEENRQRRLEARAVAMTHVVSPLIQDIHAKIQSKSNADITRTVFKFDITDILSDKKTNSYAPFKAACDGSDVLELLPADWEILNAGILKAFENQDVGVSTLENFHSVTIDYTNTAQLIETRLAREQAAKDEAARVAKEKAEAAARAAANAAADVVSIVAN